MSWIFEYSNYSNNFSKVEYSNKEYGYSNIRNCKKSAVFIAFLKEIGAIEKLKENLMTIVGTLHVEASYILGVIYSIHYFENRNLVYH